jgi:hypothetical protein
LLTKKGQEQESYACHSLNFGCMGGYGIQYDDMTSESQRTAMKKKFVDVLNSDTTISTGFYIASKKPYMLLGQNASIDCLTFQYICTIVGIENVTIAR